MVAFFCWNAAVHGYCCCNCSGSQSCKVLLFGGLIWFGMVCVRVHDAGYHAHIMHNASTAADADRRSGVWMGGKIGGWGKG